MVRFLQYSVRQVASRVLAVLGLRTSLKGSSVHGQRWTKQAHAESFGVCAQSRMSSQTWPMLLCHRLCSRLASIQLMLALPTLGI